MKHIIYLVLAVSLLVQCKANQRSTSGEKTQREKRIAFYSKINEAKINVYGLEAVNCLKGTLLKSFKNSMPRIIAEDLTFDYLDLDIYPFCKDSASCDGLYIYRIYEDNSPRYVKGTPHYFYAIKGDQVLFFCDDDSEGNRKKLESLNEISVYSEIVKYEKSVLQNLILIR